MNLTIANKIIQRFVECPRCGHDKLGKDHGGLNIKDKTLERSCRCGFRIIIDEEENVVFHQYESNGNTYCGKCDSKVEGGYCDCIAQEIRGERK